MTSRSAIAAIQLAAWPTLTTATLAGATIGEILQRFDDPEDPHVFVAAHRGGYLADDGAVAPENSLPAIRRSIEAGAEILEIDLRATSDGHLVVMHDATVTRTTDGSGAVSALTLAQVKALRLLGPDGTPTRQQVPTFAEVMTIVKGRAMVNLDKLDVTHAPSLAAAMQVLRDTGTVDHALFKGSAPAASVLAALRAYPEPIRYMPVISDASAASVVAMLEALRPPAVELIFANATTTMLSPEVLATARDTGTRIWINSLWSSLNGGHDDALAIGGNADGSWGWIAGKGATIIQTDHPVELAAYLHRIGRRDTPPAVSAIDYDFRDGTLQGWANVRQADAGALAFAADAETYGARTPAVLGDFKVIHTDFLAGRDGAHGTLVLRSPEFRLQGLQPHQSIAFSLLGGTGASAAAPASEAALPGNAGPSGFLGMALRRASDGAYLLSARRKGVAQGAAWQRVLWDAGVLEETTAADAAGESYTLDLIDAFGAESAGASVSWGWIALGAATVPWTGAGDPTAPVMRHFDKDRMALEWSSYPGFTYRVYRSGNLATESWVPASDALVSTPPVNRFSLPANPAAGDREFFRVERSGGFE